MSRLGFPKQQQYWEGRRTLLRAALHLFQQKGFEGATVEEICKKAGYSKGGFYFHFPSKEALISEILKEASTDGAKNSPPFRPGPNSLLPQLWAQAPRQATVGEWLAEYYSGRLTQMQKEIRTLVRHHDPDVLARLILALEAGLQIQWQVMISPSERRQIRRALKDLMLEQPVAAAAA